jgi:hypothetical protein
MINTLMIINIEKSLVTMKDICQFTETKSSIGYNVLRIADVANLEAQMFNLK